MRFISLSLMIKIRRERSLDYVSGKRWTAPHASASGRLFRVVKRSNPEGDFYLNHAHAPQAACQWGLLLELKVCQFAIWMFSFQVLIPDCSTVPSELYFGLDPCLLQPRLLSLSSASVWVGYTWNALGIKRRRRLPKSRLFVLYLIALLPSLSSHFI